MSATSTVNPHTYEEHSELIKSLHQAFVDHVYPPSRPEAHGDPSAFHSLPELRAARERMHKIFALGEHLWAEWIQDETMLAKSVDEKVLVMEICSKAVTEEYGSVKLWIVFGDWLHHTYRLYHEASGKDTEDIAPEEKLLGREIFSWQVVLDTWQHGAEDTTWRMNDSHQVWNRYMELLMQDLTQASSKDMIARIKSLFNTRLQIPHADWDGTFQLFSNFISTYLSSEYEDVMVTTNRKASDAKSKWEARQGMEFELQSSQNADDWMAEYTAFANYIQWERTPEKRKRLSFDLTNALYQRAALRFPTDARLWEDYVLYVVEQRHEGRATLSTIPILMRATRHCPWSGSLWAHFLLASEREGQSFSEIQNVKHEATSTGLLDVGGIEEVVKVHNAWCSYLRRRAFKPNSTDEDLDVAEMGIRSSIENLDELAVQKFGEHGHPDPKFRLERIYIMFLTESGNFDMAREIFRRLIPKHGDSWEFWLHFYDWEMNCWTKITIRQGVKANITSEASSAAHLATAVLRQAVERESLDWPERIMDAYITHCEGYAEVEDLQMAMVDVKRMEKVVATRRAVRASEVAANEQAEASMISNHPDGASTNESAEAMHIGKRKRDAGDEVNGEPGKKNKREDVDGDVLDNMAITEKQKKRDRENSTILVRSLPEHTTETRLRQFFRDCGTVNSLKFIEQNRTSATVEFDTKEAALFAQTRDGKTLDDGTIEVQLGSGSTIFVANFPQTADEEYIRELFKRCGQIIDIRFPSLKYNTHRRFCYVQFRLNAEAQAAAELDGQPTDEDLKLVAKISNPSVKQDRSGAMEEGREVYCRNMHWSASEADIKRLFEDYGEVESVRIPRKTNGQSRGFCFVVYSSEDEANAATALNGRKFLSRELHVALSSKGGAKRQATTIVSQVDRSRAPAPGQEGSVAASPSAASTTTPPPTTEHTISKDRHARTIALMNIPDTVNDSRLRALAEPYGHLVKVVLRPDHQGAIIEYTEPQSAGKASLGLEGHEITTGRHLRVGTVPEMLRQKPEKKTDKIQIGKARVDGHHHHQQLLPSRAAPSLAPQSSSQIKRPIQSTGRRGGLGQKRGLGFAPSAAVPTTSNSHPDDSTPRADGGGGGGGGKSNNDFRQILTRKNEQ